MSIARSYTLIIAGLATVLLTACRATPDPPPAPMSLVLPQSDELVIGGGPDYEFGLALAADGRHLVFPAASQHDTTGEGSDNTRALWLHDLRTNTQRRLPGTENAVLPFWSADASAIGFFAGGKLRVFELADERIRDLADAPSPRGATWLATGDILFAPVAEGALMRRAPDGTITPLTTLAAGELSHRLPTMVDSEHVIFFVRGSETARQGVWIASLDQPADRKRLVNTEAHALVAGDGLVYSNGGALVMQRLSLDTLTLTGARVLLSTTVGHSGQNALFATTGGNVLIHGTPMSALRELRWVDQTGAVIGRIGEPMQAWDARVSPSASQIAVTRVDPQLNTLDIWTYDDARPVPRRLSASINVDETPAWSRDGSRVAWVSGRQTVVVRDARATTPEITWQKYEHPIRITDWSPRDEWLVLSETTPGSRSDIVIARARPEGARQPYAQSPFGETAGTVSPDGRWLAYASDESGRPEIYVDAFPTPRTRSRVSVGGGSEPRWSRDGATLFFRRGREIHVARLAEADGALEAVSSVRLVDAGAEIRSFDVDRTGSRFLVNVAAPEEPRKPLSVLINVTSLLPAAP